MSAARERQDGVQRFSELSGQMPGVVPQFEIPHPARVTKHAHAGVVRAGPPDRAIGQVEKVPEQGADNSSVGNGQNRLPYVRRHGVIDERDHAVTNLLRALSAGYHVVRGVTIELGNDLRISFLHLMLVAETLQHTVVPLAETPIKNQLAVVVPGDRLRRLGGAAKITRVNDIERRGAQSVSQGVGLLQPTCRQTTLGLADVLAGHVGFAFTMAHGNQDNLIGSRTLDNHHTRSSLTRRSPATGQARRSTEVLSGAGALRVACKLPHPEVGLGYPASLVKLT